MACGGGTVNGGSRLTFSENRHKDRRPRPHRLGAVTSRSGRGRWQRVLDARTQAREALGTDPPGGDLYAAPPKPKSRLSETPTPAPIDPAPSERSEGVLTLGEVAVRLGISRAQLEAMIEAGTVEVLPMGLTRVIPTREIERLRKTLRRRQPEAGR